MSKEIIVFGGVWCSSCKVWKKMLDTAGVVYTEVDIDTDEGTVLATKHSVRSLPTTLVMEDGHVEHKYVGSQSPRVISDIKEMLSGV